jgi:hypothetical protein
MMERRDQEHPMEPEDSKKAESSRKQTAIRDIFDVCRIDLSQAKEDADALQKISDNLIFEENRLTATVKKLLAVSFLIDQLTDWGNYELDGVTARGLSIIIDQVAEDIKRFISDAGAEMPYSDKPAITTNGPAVDPGVPTEISDAATKPTMPLFDVTLNIPKTKTIRVEAIDATEAPSVAMDVWQPLFTVSDPDDRKRFVYLNDGSNFPPSRKRNR